MNMKVSPDAEETAFLALRTTPYSENSMIVAGVSPQHGRLSFLVGGALRCGRRGRSPFGLFRRLRVSFTPRERDLQAVDEAELLEDYTPLTRDYQGYECACWLAQFALGNVLPGQAAEFTFRSLRVAFVRLAACDVPPVAVQTGVLLVYMNENGLLEADAAQPQQTRQCQVLVDMALGGPVPALRDDNWLALRDWVLGRLAQTDGILPRS